MAGDLVLDDVSVTYTQGVGRSLRAVDGVSLRIVDEQGWLWRLLDFKTDNPDTSAAFAAIRDELHRWLHAQSA